MPTACEHKETQKKGSFEPNTAGAQTHANIYSNKHHQITQEVAIRNENTLYGYSSEMQGDKTHTYTQAHTQGLLLCFNAV